MNRIGAMKCDVCGMNKTDTNIFTADNKKSYSACPTCVEELKWTVRCIKATTRGVLEKEVGTYRKTAGKLSLTPLKSIC